MVCVQMLREARVPFVAAINPDRFKPIVRLMTDRVQATGEKVFG